MAYKVGFSIPNEDEAVYKYLMNLKRMKSRFIVNCIKKVMENPELINDTSGKFKNNNSDIDKTELESLFRKVLKEELENIEINQKIEDDNIEQEMLIEAVTSNGFELH